MNAALQLYYSICQRDGIETGDGEGPHTNAGWEGDGGEVGCGHSGVKCFTLLQLCFEYGGYSWML